MLEQVTKVGSLLGIKTAPLVQRLMPLAGSWNGPLVATIPHQFHTMSITIDVARDTARSICGDWLDALPGDRIRLELGVTSAIAHSDEAAFPADTPAVVHALGDDLASVAWDGEGWTCAIAQANADDAAMEATIARFDTAAATLGITESQRKIGARLHRALARGRTTRVWSRARNGEPRSDPRPRVG